MAWRQGWLDHVVICSPTTLPLHSSSVMMAWRQGWLDHVVICSPTTLLSWQLTWIWNHLECVEWDTSHVYLCMCVYLYACLSVCVANTAGRVLPVQQQARLVTCWDWLPDEPGDSWTQWELHSEFARLTRQPYQAACSRPQTQQTQWSEFCSVGLSVCLPVCLSVCLSLGLSACQSLCLSMCLYVSLSVCLYACVCLCVKLSVLDVRHNKLNELSWSLLLSDISCPTPDLIRNLGKFLLHVM